MNHGVIETIQAALRAAPGVRFGGRFMSVCFAGDEIRLEDVGNCKILARLKSQDFKPCLVSLTGSSLTFAMPGDATTFNVDPNGFYAKEFQRAKKALTQNKSRRMAEMDF